MRKPVAQWSQVRLFRAIERAHIALNDVHRRILPPSIGLTLSEFDVIATLGNTDGMRMKDVASKTLTSPANTTRIVSDLEDRGLVVRHRSKQSDREVLATLTAKGNALFQKTFLEVARFTAETIDSALSERDQTRVATHLEALVKLMKPGRPPLG